MAAAAQEQELEIGIMAVLSGTQAAVVPATPAS
jgi:hypothetical protein